MTPPQRDCYEVLGVARDADAKAIKNAFRTLALQYHPDRNKEPGAEERFKEIAEAYAILSDPKKRADYDARGFAGVAGLDADDLFSGINFDDIFGGLNFDFGHGGLFGDLFRSRRSGPSQGANVEVELWIPLERVASGGEEQLHLSRPVACSSCHGTGEAGGATPPKCEACGGTGRMTRQQRKDHDQILIQHITTCPTCGGRGTKLQNPCSQCQGAGQIEREDVLTVKIPKGVEEGLALRIPGKGQPSAVAGGPNGDLFAVVRTRPDARFERMGSDLMRLETISVLDAVPGSSLSVPTLDGTASVRVPPGTQPDTILRLKAKGLPAFGEGPHADLYLRIAVKVPEHLTRHEREFYQKLREIVRPEAAAP